MRVGKMITAEREGGNMKKQPKWEAQRQCYSLDRLQEMIFH